MYLEEYRNSFAFYEEENNQVLKVVNFQPVLRYSYQEYLADGRKYIREIRKEYPQYKELLKEETSREYYATEYATQVWKKDCEEFGQECREIIEICNREFLAMPKLERKKKINRLEELFSRCQEEWKYLFSDYESLLEDYRYLLSWKD